VTPLMSMMCGSGRSPGLVGEILSPAGASGTSEAPSEPLDLARNMAVTRDRHNEGTDLKAG
jgi:hypothetical protein